MAYQLPRRPHIASRWLTATLVGIYAVIIALILLLSTDSSGNINRDKKSGYSGNSGINSRIDKPVSAYNN